MESSHTPKTWLITGTSSGLGRTMTEALLARGDRVVATVRGAGLDELSARYGDRLSVVVLDVTEADSVRTVIDDAFARMGRIDVVVSNAGFGLFGAAEELSDDDIRRQIETNLIGSISLIRAVLPHLRAQGGGRIVQVSSEGGQIAYPNFSVYHATKWGIEGFIEAVAQEVGPFGIAFTIVEPGPTKTSFGASAVRAPAMDAYDATPSGDIRRALRDGRFGTYADAQRSVRAMIDVAEAMPAPKRVVLGGEPHARVRAALASRIAELDAQKDVAYGIDA